MLYQKISGLQHSQLHNRANLVAPAQPACAPSCSTAQVCVTAPQPYPPVAVECANLNYARMLYQPLADSQSETTAIHQYLYQSWILSQEDPSLSQLLLQIAQVEMHHLQILGELIVLLGGNPKSRSLTRSGFRFWSGNVVNYSTNVREVLQLNHSSEEFAASSYHTLSRLIHDPCISSMMARLALDEELHARIFHEAL